MGKTNDLRHLDEQETHKKLGELLLQSLSASRVALFVRRSDDTITLVSPAVLAAVSPEELASSLFAADWSEEQVEEYLTYILEP